MLTAKLFILFMATYIKLCVNKYKGVLKWYKRALPTNSLRTQDVGKNRKENIPVLETHKLLLLPQFKSISLYIKGCLIEMLFNEGFNFKEAELYKGPSTYKVIKR